MSRTLPSAAVCLLILIAALLAVGVVSGTLFRHVIQCVAPAVALFALRRDAVLGRYAALPIFIFWLAIVSLIWLYLAGLSSFASGTYSAVEILLTVIMAAACLAGFIAVFRDRPPTPLGPAFRTAAAFALVQLFSMFLSFHPLISGD